MKFAYFFIISFFLAVSVQAGEEAFTPTQKEALNKIIDEHLMKNPEILVTALDQLQQKQIKQQREKARILIQQNKDALFSNTNDYVESAASASIPMVVFMDPYCGHCKKFHEIIKQALDPSNKGYIKDLKIIYKDLPLFGEDSDRAVKAMHAAKLQGQYPAFQQELFKKEKPASKEEIIEIASQLKLDTTRFLKDMESDQIKALISSNRQLAEKLGIRGTPSFIIGDFLTIGGASLSDLKELIEKAKNPEKSK
jgi:protein-disulfide isomerase